MNAPILRITRFGVALAVICGLSRSADLDAGAVCRKVAETYHNLRSFQLSATVSDEFDRSAPMSMTGDMVYTLATVRPDKFRFTQKDKRGELIIVSDGETTWKYLPRAKQHTKESLTTLDEEDLAETPSQQDQAEPLTRALSLLVKRYIGLAKYGDLAVFGHDDQVKVDGVQVDCYHLQLHLPTSSQEFWVDKQRFLVLRHADTSKTQDAGTTVTVRTTMSLKHIDISNEPDAGLFSFTPPEHAVLVKALSFPGARLNLTGRIAQDFTLKAFDGENVTLSELRGKVVLIDFWATWCPPCRKELPSLEKLYRTYRDKGLIVYGINNEDIRIARDYLRKHQFELPVLTDPKKDVLRLYGVRVIPTVLVIGPDGVIRAHFTGDRSEKELLAALKTAGLETGTE